MRTRQQLSAALAAHNAEAVSKLANVCTKTIYRIRRDSEYSPNLKTVEKLFAALELLSGKRRASKA